MAEKDLNEETVIQEDEAVVTEEESGKDNDNKSSDNTEAAGETQQNEENVNADADAEETPKEGETEAETEESDEAAEGKEKKKLFKKKEKKDKKDEKIEALTDQVKRQMAEFDNFRKRTEKEKSSMYEMGAKSVIEKILPVIDNFERGLDTVPADEADSPFTEGMRMIYKQLMTELDDTMTRNRAEGRVTVAFGISDFNRGVDMRMQDVFERADAKMYTYKRKFKE